ncbi:unnamed protein product [Thelazia callipaeda]|uniref:Metallo-beta-lactamase domain-containing protein 1 n=1 Tax=Thelazia callipaeda TaxID=103827 RepID=A0A0N5DAT0_THECL|nr:unnamed protein product [Thelazia callipaeda]
MDTVPTDSQLESQFFSSSESLFSTERDSDDYKFMSSVTLVTDGEFRVLVDTGLATDINGETFILKRLNEIGALPSSITHVITTHGHLDHSGNNNDFANAIHYIGRFKHSGMYSNFSRIFKDEVEILTRNIHLLKSPGHTSEDISVFVRNTSFFGNVIISGDVFIRKEDLKYPNIWKSLAINEMQQEESRRRLACIADHIIPGHGPIFRVTNRMKRKFKCIIN